MTAIQVDSWTSPPNVAEARTLIGQVLAASVDAEIRPSGTPFMNFVRFVRVQAVHERAESDRVCQHCHEPAQIAFEVSWEVGATAELAKDVCEQCTFGRVIHGSEALVFEE